jgi:hypothetical protein
MRAGLVKFGNHIGDGIAYARNVGERACFDEPPRCCDNADRLVAARR